MHKTDYWTDKCNIENMHMSMRNVVLPQRKVLLPCRLCCGTMRYQGLCPTPSSDRHTLPEEPKGVVRASRFVDRMVSAAPCS